MKKLSSSQKIQKRLVENTTLFWTLCEVPGEPKENDIHVGHDEGRQLSGDRERQLTDSFAFISATTDDMLRVMAVSIEEDPDKKGMTVRMASNTGDLSVVTEGLNGIARTLELASLRKSSRIDMQQDLFRQIIALDEPRILSRLRSIHAEESRKTKGKPELLYLLNRTVHDKSILGRSKSTKANITNIRSCSKGLSEMFSRFETVRSDENPVGRSRDILIDLLIRIDGFDIDKLQKVLRTSPTINPSTRKYLPEAMRKLGSYFRIACDLISAARSPEYTLFQRISVRSIKEPQVNMPFITDGSTHFDEVAQRFISISHGHLLHAHSSALVSAARTKYQSRMSNHTVPWKVHAEIQLLLFYERRPHIPRPRIIGSSKSACYLCNLFIQLHGKFGTPRTHGRLYDRWILPEQSINQTAANFHLLSVIDRFNKALEAKINDNLHHRTQPFPQPNESVVHLRQAWLSNSTLAETVKQASIQEIVDPTHSSPSRDRTKAPSDTSSRRRAFIEEIVEPTRSNPAKDQTRPLSNTSSSKQGSIQETMEPTHPSSSRDRSRPSSNISSEEQASIQSIVKPPPNPSSIDRTPPPSTRTTPPPRLKPSISENPPPLNNPPLPPPPASTNPRPQPVAQRPHHLANLDPPAIRSTTPRTKSTPSLSSAAATATHNFCPDTSTTYKLLADPHDTLIIDAGPVVLHASHTPSNNSIITTTNEPPRPCWIHVQCSTKTSTSHTSHSEDEHDERTFEFIDIDSLSENQDTIFEAGAALSEKVLALRVQGQVVVVVKFACFGGEREMYGK